MRGFNITSGQSAAEGYENQESSEEWAWQLEAMNGQTAAEGLFFSHPLHPTADTVGDSGE